MGSVYRRGNKLWFKFKGPDGGKVQKPSGFDVGQETQARAVLERIEQRIRGQESIEPTELGPLRVERYATLWLTQRQALDLADWKNDETRLRLHILPRIGSLRLDAVRPRHLKDLFTDLRVEGKLAPHTLRNIYSVLKAMFRDALARRPDLVIAVHSHQIPARRRRLQRPRGPGRLPLYPRRAGDLALRRAPRIRQPRLLCPLRPGRPTHGRGLRPALAEP